MTLTQKPATTRTGLLAAGAALITVVLWASAFVAIRHVGHDFSAGALSLGRLIVGSAILGAFVFARRPKRLPAPVPLEAGTTSEPDTTLTGASGLRGDSAAGTGLAAGVGSAVAQRWPERRDWPLLLVCGLLWFGVYNVALNAAEQRLDAGTAAMLVNIGPLLIALLAGVLLKEGFPRRLVIGSAVAFAGVLLIGTSSSTGKAETWGVILCVLAAITYAIGVVAQKPLLGRLPALQVTWLACTIGAVACLPFAPALVRELSTASASSIWWVVFLGAFPTALAFTTWAYALARSSAGRMGATTYLVPPIAIAFAWLLLDEVPAPLAFAGGALCLAGVAISRQRKPA
ncbi:DMT family transporter [Kribbella deserti]|uniref:DMT family transporter n=1 Tax=Kribbella deserti TaxID=1926257 RepID=A0ABV6QJN5_9ACTN